MYRIRVTGAKAKDMFNLGEKYRKLSMQGRDKVAQRLKDLLIRNAEAYGLTWKGRLVDTIDSRPLSDEELEVSLAFYSWAIEKGHKIPAGVNLPLLTAWARDKMGTRIGNAWIAKVKREGHVVLARPFISDSFESLKPMIIPLYEEELKRK